MKKFLLVISIVVCLIEGKVTSFAYDKSLTPKNDATNVLSWHQSSHPKRNDPSVPSEAGMFEVASGRTLGEMGCSYFAASYMLVKMGEENPKEGFTPVEFAKKVMKGKYFEGNNYVDFASIGKMYPNVTCETNMGSAEGTSLKQQMAWVKGKFNEGYFIIICVTSTGSPSGHYIFVDGFTDDGDMIIGDSAREKDRWSDVYANTNGTIATVSLFKHKKVKSNECPSIYDGVTLGSSGLSKQEQELYNGLVKEWGLTGMPKASSYITNQEPIYLEDISSLSDLESENIGYIKENIKVGKLTKSGIIGIICSFIGMLLCVYSTLLAVSVILDRLNVWIDFSVTSLLTLGKCKVYSAEDILGYKDKLNKGEYTIKKWYIICIIIFGIGLLLISGLIEKAIYTILGIIW